MAATVEETWAAKPGDRVPLHPLGPAEELEEIERLQAEGGPPGVLQAGATYFLVGRRWLAEWRRWVGQPVAGGACGRRRSRSVSGAAPAPRGTAARSAARGSGEPGSGPPGLEPAPSRRPRVASAERRQPTGAAAGLTERPGPVDNRPLLLEERPGRSELRQGLREHLDFEVVTSGVWERLYDLYGGGPAIGRVAVRLPSGEVRLELGGLSLRACRYSERRSCLHVESPRGATIATLKMQLCQKFGLDHAKVRLWHEQDGERLQLVEGSQDLTLEACHIGNDHLLLLEEQQPNGTWPLGSFGNSGRVPEKQAPNGFNKSQPRLRARTAGIQNLGNTCFMSSSLQCLAHVPALRDYFLGDSFREALKGLGQPAEQAGGKLAEGFAALLKRLWREESSALSPWAFKDQVERIADRFSGNRQHDSMEFVEFLIDGLKEDCNRVKGKKPYVERADADGRPDGTVALEAANGFLLRNDSFVDDLFVGFHKITTTCPECSRESVVFDPFLSVKVPVASPREGEEARFAVTVVPAVSSGRPIAKHRLAASRSGTAGDLCSAVAAEAGLRPDHCVLAEVFSGRVYKLFEDVDRLEDISPSDVLILYELEEAPAMVVEAKKRWGPGKAAMEGDIVVATSSFKSNSNKKTQLKQGVYGKVVQVDSDGDALVKFDGIDTRQWVFKKNLANLTVDLTIHSEERRICPDDKKDYTLRELVQLFDDQYSLEDLRAYWRDVMKPVGEVPEEARVCAAIVHFRQTDAQKKSLFGIPLVTSLRRDTTGREVAEVIHGELARRLGPGGASGWQLYQADSSWEAMKSDRVVWDGEAALEEELWLRERDYFAVEWEDEPPAEVSAMLEEAALRSEEPSETRLEQCFEWLTEVEQLSESESVYCSGCKEHRQVFRKMELWSLPPVLVLQLKRFEFSSVTRRKVSTPVRFPLEGLDLCRFSLSQAGSFPEGQCLRAGQRVVICGLQSAAGQKLNGVEGVAMYLDTGSVRFCVRLRDGDPCAEWKKLKPANLEPLSPPAASGGTASRAVFDLVALSKHMGGTSFGHYMAYARSSEDGVWRLFDDDEVREVQAQEVEAELAGAYVLFYLRRDWRPPGWGPAKD